MSIEKSSSKSIKVSMGRHYIDSIQIDKTEYVHISLFPFYSRSFQFARSTNVWKMKTDFSSVIAVVSILFTQNILSLHPLYTNNNTRNFLKQSVVSIQTMAHFAIERGNELKLKTKLIIPMENFIWAHWCYSTNCFYVKIISIQTTT